MSSIHPRLDRAVSLATWMLRTGEKRNEAKTTAAKRLPTIPARIPKKNATASSTTLKSKGTAVFQECPDAMVLTPRAATPQTVAPISGRARRNQLCVPAAIARLIAVLIALAEIRMTETRVAAGKIESCWNENCAAVQRAGAPLRQRPPIFVAHRAGQGLSCWRVPFP